MKKNILFMSVAIIGISLAAVGFNKMGKNENASFCKKNRPSADKIELLKFQSEREFHYEVSNRFAATITKEDLVTAKSIVDIVPKKATHGIDAFQNVKVAVLDAGKEAVELGENQMLTAAQLKLLQLSDYSTDFYINADYKSKITINGIAENEHLVYYMTIVPEEQAFYQDGQQALIDYLKTNSKNEANSVDMKLLQPGKVRFTVSKIGIVSGVTLESTSGYTNLDIRMIELVQNMPGKWTPAKNAKGEKVNQEFVFSFGLIGC